MIQNKSYAFEIMHSFLYFIPFLLIQIFAKEDSALHQITLLINFLIFMILTSFLLFARKSFFRRNTCIVFSLCNLTIIILLFTLNMVDNHHIFFKGIYYHYLIDIIFSKKKKNSIFLFSFIVLLCYFIYLVVMQNSLINRICLFYLVIYFIKRININPLQSNPEAHPNITENNFGTIFFSKNGNLLYLDKKWKEFIVSKTPNTDKKIFTSKSQRNLLFYLKDFKLADIEKKLKFLQSLKGHSTKSIDDVKKNFEKLISINSFHNDSSKSISIKVDEVKTVPEKIEVILPELILKKKGTLKLSSTSTTTKDVEEKKLGCTFLFKTFFINIKDRIRRFLKYDIFSIFRQQEFILADSFYVTNKSSKKLMKLSVFRINNSNHRFCIRISKSNEEEINNILNEVKKIFSGIITSLSHELKTPMNCSLNLLEILANSVTDEIFNELMIPIIQSTKHLKMIISDLIDYSNIISGNFCLDYNSFKLEEVLNELVKNLREKAELKGVDIKFEYNLEKDQIIYSDGNRIKQIVFNLLSNSLKYTEEGFILLQVNPFNPELSQKYNLVEIRVQDSGSGINSNDIAQLGKISEKRNSKLVGLGLTASNYIAEYLCPQPLSGLYVKSKEGKGSVFVFVIENKISMIDENKPSFSEKKLAKMNTNPIDFQTFLFNSSWDSEQGIIIKSPQKLSLFSKRNSKNEIFAMNDDDTGCDMFSLPNNIDKYLVDNHAKYLKKDVFDKKIINLIMPPENATKEMKTKWKSIDSSLNIYPTTSSLFKSLGSQTTNNEDLIIEKELRKSKENLSKCKCPDILLVDDTYFNILALQKMLSKYNLVIDQAANGKEAIEKVKKLYENSNCPQINKCVQYKVILMDLDMPGIDGLNASIEILKYFKLKNIFQKIIICTAFADQLTKDQCKNAGLNDYITKPVSKEDLKKIVELYFVRN